MREIPDSQLLPRNPISPRSSSPRGPGRLGKLLLAGVIAGCALLVGAPQAEAQPGGPKAEVLVIHGTQCDKPSVDPAIGEVPPLKYNCYRLLDRKLLPLQQGAPSTMQLANGRIFQVTYNGLSGDKPRML